VRGLFRHRGRGAEVTREEMEAAMAFVDEMPTRGPFYCVGGVAVYDTDAGTRMAAALARARTLLPQALAEVKRLREAVNSLAEALPRCACGEVALRCRGDGFTSYCDEHAAENAREWTTRIAPDLPYAAPLRAAISLLSRKDPTP